MGKNNIKTVYQNSFANIARFLLPNLTVKNIDKIPLESVYRAFWYRWLLGINLIKTQARFI